MRKLPHVVAVVLGSLLAVSADAATFTLTPATPGVTFTIENLGLAATDLYAADGTDDTFQLLLTLTTTTSYVDAGGGADLLAAFSVDLGATDLQGVALASAPSGFSWTLLADNRVPGNSAKCNGNEAGSFCVEETASATGNLVLDANATYGWLFNVDLGAGGFGAVTGLDVGIGTLKQTGPNYAFHGSRMISGVTGSMALASESVGNPPPTGSELVTAPVPEPGSLVLLGSGLLLAASRMRRGKK